MLLGKSVECAPYSIGVMASQEAKNGHFRAHASQPYMAVKAKHFAFIAAKELLSKLADPSSGGSYIECLAKSLLFSPAAIMRGEVIR